MSTETKEFDFPFYIVIGVLRQIREKCRNIKCKECKYYVSGKIVDHCLFDDMPMDWKVYKLENNEEK